MSTIETKELLPGMVTAAPVFTKTGQQILEEHVTLDKKLIARLDFYSIPSVEILEKDAAVPEPEKTAPATQEEAPAVEEKEPAIDRAKFAAAGRASNFQKIQRSDRFRDFQVSYSRSVLDLSKALDGMIVKSFPTSKELLSTSLQVLNEHRMTTIELFDMLHNMRQNDDSVYAHSLNVAFIARILGKWMKLEKDEIEELTLAGLLHDVGKLMIPKPILNKPGKLTDQEFEIVRMHPQFGYDLLKDQNYPKRILDAVLNHHERCDGSGYPNKLSGDSIDDFTLVIATADVYDAMTAARSYRAPLSPFAVIENFENEGLQKYRPHVIMTFLERIANTYQNNRVLLSNGTQGTIVLLNSNRLSRPILKLDNEEFLDLSMNSSLSIVSLL